MIIGSFPLPSVFQVSEQLSTEISPYWNPISSSCVPVARDINTAFDILGIILIVFAIGLIITGLKTMNIVFVSVGIAAIILSAIVLLIGFFTTSIISNELCY